MPPSRRRRGVEDPLLPSPVVLQRRPPRIVRRPACAARTAFLKYRVNVVFSGHDHVYERLVPQKGIYYFVSGSGGQLRRGNMRRSEQTAVAFDQDLSFMLVEVAGAEMFFQVISRTGQTVDSGMIRRQEPAQ